MSENTNDTAKRLAALDEGLIRAAFGVTALAIVAMGYFAYELKHRETTSSLHTSTSCNQPIASCKKQKIQQVTPP